MRRQGVGTLEVKVKGVGSRRIAGRVAALALVKQRGRVSASEGW